MTERRLVKVACTIPNGLTIHLPGISHDDGTGKQIASMGQKITLKGPGALALGVNQPTSDESILTVVDEEVMNAWLAHNALSPMVTGGAVYIVGPVDQPEEEPFDPAAQEPETSIQQVELGAAVGDTGKDDGDAGGGQKDDGKGEKPAPEHFSADRAKEIGGYPNGAVLASVALPGVDWVSEVDGNMTDPDSGEAEGWVEREAADPESDDEGQF